MVTLTLTTQQALEALVLVTVAFEREHELVAALPPGRVEALRGFDTALCAAISADPDTMRAIDAEVAARKVQVV